MPKIRKLFIHSVHSILEYDQAQMFLGLGYGVRGRFDVYHTQRPKLPGVTDRIAIPAGADVILVHQCRKYADVVKNYALTAKPVVALLFGQGNPEGDARLACHARRYPNIHVVCYSRKEHEMMAGLAVPASRLHLIRFGKSLQEFGLGHSWLGADETCFVPCNRLAERSYACGWNLVQELIREGLPLRISGIGSETMSGGLGDLPYDVLLAQYRNSRCTLCVGTVPAPYTLAFVEAVCSGSPVVVLDNGCGITEEGFGVQIVRSASEAGNAIHALLNDRGAAGRSHETSMLLAKRCFDAEKIALQWQALIEVVLA